MIKNCVFDLGNVLVRFEPIKYIKCFVGDEAFARRLADQLFLCRWWKAGDRGEMQRDDIIDAICADDPVNESLIRRILVGCDKMLEAIDVNVELLRDLKSAGFSLYYLSNTNSEAFIYMTSIHSFFSYFDGGIVSFKEGVLKPDNTIFRLFLERFGLEADTCVFCDDMPVNTEAARIMGFATVTLSSPEQLREKLNGFPEISSALKKLY